MTRFAISPFGCLCGAVSALLFAVITTGATLALPLYLLAPVPIMVAAMGWGLRGGFSAALFATVLVGFIFTPVIGGIYGITIGFSSFLLGFLCVFSQSVEPPGGVIVTRWLPPGTLLVWVGRVAVVSTLYGLFHVAPSYSALIDLFHQMVTEFADANPRLIDGIAPGDKAAAIDEIVQVIAIAGVPLSVAITMAISVLLLYACGRLVQASGRLDRPWPDLSSTRMGNHILVTIGAGIGLAVFSSDYYALIGRAALGACLVAYCLQGLAILHAVTHPLKTRRAILITLYTTFVLLPGWPILGFALLGAADVAFDFRQRALKAAQGSAQQPL